MDRILIETDSPYLTPHPFRGKINHPSNVKYVCDEIAKIKNIETESVSKCTTNNFNRIFFKSLDKKNL